MDTKQKSKKIFKIESERQVTEFHNLSTDKLDRTKGGKNFRETKMSQISKKPEPTKEICDRLEKNERRMKPEKRQVEKSPTNILKKKDSKDKFPQNINEYRHIIDTLQVNDEDLKFVLNLRSYKPIPGAIEKIGSTHPPSFFGADLTKHKKKSVWDPTFNGESKAIEHLMKNRLGPSPNFSQLEFETNLRPDKKELASFTHSKWVSPPYSPKRNSEILMFPPTLDMSKKSLSKFTKGMTQKMETSFEKVDYRDRKIIKRNLKPSKMTLGFMGDHYSLENYNMKYDIPNMNETRHILANTNCHSESKWITGLRYLDPKFNPPPVLKGRKLKGWNYVFDRKSLSKQKADN